VDGFDAAVVGDSTLHLLRLHPADNNPPADNVINISEMTAYGAAWKRGQAWPVAPNPIAIAYVTRAAQIWNQGEYYRYDPSVTNEPLCWTNTTPPQPEPVVTNVLNGATNTAVSSITNRYTPTVPIWVTIAVAVPTNAMVYALEDQIPLGWTATNLSPNGHFDSANRKVKWGPFFDASERIVSYQVIPPMGATGTVMFVGVLFYNGDGALIAGDRQLAFDDTPTRFLTSWSSFSRTNGFMLTLNGPPGATYIIETSTNLASWHPLATNSLVDGLWHFIDATATNGLTRFYRARMQ
jgi:hypothetical protein